MTVPVSELKPAPPDDRRSDHRGVWVVLAVVAALFAAVALVVALGGRLFHDGGHRAVPAFPSLAANPDPSLHGTVAYFAADSSCIRLVAAAGQPSRELWCLPKESTSTWVKLGKPVGPQLVWRPDGRLEVTMFRMLGKGSKTAPALGPGWQKLIDVRTGAVESVPAAQLPSVPDTTSQPTTSPTGQTVAYTFDQSSGRVRVTLSDSTGTRTLLSVHGPGEYTYRFGPVFWAPNWTWIAAAEESRILVITPGAQPETRVLVTGTGSGVGAGGGTAGPEFAVTSADLLTSTK